MKATSNTNEPSRDDAVTRELLLLADRQEIQPPPDVLDRVRARLHENTVRSPSAAPARATVPMDQEGLVRRRRRGGSCADRTPLLPATFQHRVVSSGGSRSCRAVDSCESRRRRRPIVGNVDFVFPKHRRFTRQQYGPIFEIFGRASATSTTRRKRSYTACRCLMASRQGIRVGGRTVSGDFSWGCHSRGSFLTAVPHRQAAAADGDRTRPAMDPVRIGATARERRSRTANRDSNSGCGNPRRS